MLQRLPALTAVDTLRLACCEWSGLQLPQQLTSLAIGIVHPADMAAVALLLRQLGRLRRMTIEQRHKLRGTD